MVAAELWQQLNASETIKCDVVAEATYTEFYRKYHPDALKEDVDQRHGGERIDVLISFPEVPADVLIEVKLYDDGKDWIKIVEDVDKLRRVAGSSPRIRCYVAVYVTQVENRPDMSLPDRIEDLARKIGCEVIAGRTQKGGQKPTEWEWCFATLEVSAVQQSS